MTEWQPVLRHVDVTPLSAEETESIRTAMLAAAASTASCGQGRSPAGAVISGLLGVAVAAGVIAARSVDAPGVAVPAPTAAAAAPVAAPIQNLRHLQFATPGGTRIIWQFDPQFSWEQTLP